ncbi:MAG: HAMP domain-containing histidine kinase [Sphingobacterium sp.]|jgi:two-component system phosphate regulon sensor histidine kinase PhoR|nr:HAMP domain-containing histidine kinase [Sphingobacterium sp.]
MKAEKYSYRKNYGLLLMFFIVISGLYIFALFLSRSYTESHIKNEFTNRKSEIFDQTLIPFNDFFQNRIPEVSFYQGFLDSVQAGKYAYSILSSYPFVREIGFFDLQFNNDHNLNYGFIVNNLRIQPKTITFFTVSRSGLNKNTIRDRGQMGLHSEEINNIGVKLATYIDKLQPNAKLSDKDILKVFYTIRPGQITYLNIPRVNDLIVYKSIMEGNLDHTVGYEQDMFNFQIDPMFLEVKNSYANLYEKVDIVPLVGAPITPEQDEISTEMPLPGALADYKLLFRSSKSFLSQEINRSFWPVLGGISLIYIILIAILYLIYRNLEINGRLFKLQYDFINNLTHEFKTPVSVIKIAGNNIKSAQVLSDEERKMYGNILDQEADRLNNLMNKLLSFSQIENKTIKLNKEEVDLEEFTENLVASSRIKYADFKISTKIDVRTSMLADPVLLSSVFQNMIDNAYKYSKAGHKILDIAIQQNKKNFVITFKDEGIGIEKAEFNNIFKKFYRIKSQYNQQGSIGLGLAFCKEITEFIGGDITVKSQLGQGTTFTLVFPV